jgi:hypothetical protein
MTLHFKTFYSVIYVVIFNELKRTNLTKKQKKKKYIQKKCVFNGIRTHAHRVEVQSPTTDLLIPCLYES